jgi:hypothetical protein
VRFVSPDVQDGHVHVQCDPCFISQLLVLAEPELSGTRRNIYFSVHDFIILLYCRLENQCCRFGADQDFLGPVRSVFGIILRVNADPDPAFRSMQIRIQHFTSMQIRIQHFRVRIQIQ